MVQVKTNLHFAVDNGVVRKITDDDAPIVVYTNLSSQDRAFLVQEVLIDEHTLQSALDPDEIARLEFEPSHVAAIIKRPASCFEELSWEFTVASMGAFLFEDRLIIVQSEGTPLFKGGRPFARCNSLKGAFLQLIYHSIAQFLANIKLINHVSNSIGDNIEYSLGNTALSRMFELQKSLVYYQSAAHSNAMLLNKLRMNADRIGFSVEEKELLDDMIVENNQCSTLVEMYQSILTGMSDARVSIVSNHLSILMKKLTVISVVFMPLNILASMGGMSEYSLFTKHMPWPASYSLFTLIMVILGYVTWLVIRNIGIEERPSRKRNRLMAVLAKPFAVLFHAIGL